MKQILIAANWKSNKNLRESLEWFYAFAEGFREIETGIKEKSTSVIVCAPYTDLYPLNEALRTVEIGIDLGAQDVSPFPEGAYTGQITAGMIAGLCQWVIIGHSERRKYFRETDEELAKKCVEVNKTGLKIIYCVSDQAMPVPSGVDVVAYEPLWAIGTGKTDTPENAAEVVRQIKSKSGVETVLYGGSVKDDNVRSFLSTGDIDGVLIGGASLKSDSFLSLIRAAIS